MIKFILSLSFLTATFITGGANANADINISQSFVKGDHVIFAESESLAQNSAFKALVGALQGAGYALVTELADPVHQVKTWCRAIADLQEVLGECYSPHQGHGVTLKDSVKTVSSEDFSKVLPMIERLRQEHGDATAMLSIK